MHTVRFGHCDKVSKLYIITQKHQKFVTGHLSQCVFRQHIRKLDCFHILNHVIIYTNHVEKNFHT